MKAGQGRRFVSSPGEALACALGAEALLWVWEHLGFKGEVMLFMWGICLFGLHSLESVCGCI